MASLSKNKIKYIHSLELKKIRKEERVFLAEGPKLVGDLLGHFPCRFLAATPIIEGKRIVKYYGIVSGETIIGANVFRDLFASIRDIVGGRSGSYEEVLRMAKDTALKEMEAQAAQMGANAVIGVDLDYETVGGSGSMLMVTANGTAVKIEED